MAVHTPPPKGSYRHSPPPNVREPNSAPPGADNAENTEEPNDQDDASQQADAQKQWAEQLQRSKNNSQQNQPENQDHSEKKNKALAGLAKTYDIDLSNLSAEGLGKAIGDNLRQRIMTGSFKGFLAAIVLAVVKDFWDPLAAMFIFFDAGIISTSISIIITIALWRIVMFQGIWLKRLIIKKLFGRIIIAFIAELIPGVNVFPMYTLSILMIRHYANKEQKRNENALEELQKITGEKKKK